MPKPLIDHEHANFMQGGISLNIGSCGADRMPSVARAVGCSVSPDLMTVRLVVSAVQSAQVLEHVRLTASLAAVFSEPSSHRTIQLKASDAHIVAATEHDVAVARRYRHAFVAQLEPLHHSAELIYAFLQCPDADLVALVFTPDAAYSQTPGPGAGQPLVMPA